MATEGGTSVEQGILLTTWSCRITSVEMRMHALMRMSSLRGGIKPNFLIFEVASGCFNQESHVGGIIICIRVLTCGIQYVIESHSHCDLKHVLDPGNEPAVDSLAERPFVPGWDSWTLSDKRRSAFDVLAKRSFAQGGIPGPWGTNDAARSTFREGSLSSVFVLDSLQREQPRLGDLVPHRSGLVSQEIVTPSLQRLRFI